MRQASFSCASAHAHRGGCSLPGLAVRTAAARSLRRDAAHAGRGAAATEVREGGGASTLGCPAEGVAPSIRCSLGGRPYSAAAHFAPARRLLASHMLAVTVLLLISARATPAAAASCSTRAETRLAPPPPHPPATVTAATAVLTTTTTVALALAEPPPLPPSPPPTVALPPS